MSSGGAHDGYVLPFVIAFQCLFQFRDVDRLGIVCCRGDGYTYLSLAGSNTTIMDAQSVERERARDAR